MANLINKLPSEICMYGNFSPEEKVLNEAGEAYSVTKIEATYEGTKTYIEGALYPSSGFPIPEAIWHANILKRTIIGIIKIIASPLMVPSFVLILLFGKKSFLNKVLQFFNALGAKTIRSYVLKYYYLTLPSKEIQDFAFNFLTSLKIPDRTAQATAEYISTLIELDYAYRFRIQDIAGEININRLKKSPVSETRRLIGIAIEREKEVEVKIKLKALKIVVPITLLIPYIRKAFNQSLITVNLSNLRYDDADRYWAYMRKDYDVEGKTEAQREEYLSKLPLPKKFKVEKQKI